MLANSIKFSITEYLTQLFSTYSLTTFANSQAYTDVIYLYYLIDIVQVSYNAKHVYV